jgi:sugar/nucleoside kinase (ribokinase family)
VRVGGGPFYAGRALRALHRRGVVLTKCAGEDRRTLLTPLVCLGLPVLWQASASTAAFGIDYGGEERHMTVDGLGDEWTPEEIRGWVGRGLDGAGWVQVAALRRGEFSAQALAELARGRRVLLDGQGLVRPPATGPLEPDADYDPSVLEHVSVLKLSEHEAELIAGGLDQDALRSLGVPEVIVTLGSRGALVLDRAGLEQVPARAVEPAGDPTGAGDAFGAAYISARADGNGPAGAARRAAGLVADLLAGRLR